MRKFYTVSSAAVFLAVLSGGAMAAKPHIEIVATGGTIAGAQPKPGELGYKSGEFDIQRLIDAVPQIKDLADVTGEQLVSIGSQDMNDEIWLKLAKRVNELARRPDVDAVVITHGTDTMEETGYFLSLVIKTQKPIVMVGSMRPATSISADGPMNLYEGVAAAASSEASGRGVLVVLNDQIHFAREVEKRNTTSLNTFEVSQPRTRGACRRIGRDVLRQASDDVWPRQRVLDRRHHCAAESRDRLCVREHGA